MQRNISSRERYFYKKTGLLFFFFPCTRTRATLVVVAYQVQRAKNGSEYEKAMRIMETMRTRPRKAWKKTRSLQAGHNSHHRVNQVVYFARNGIKATSNKENVGIACSHFEKVYSRESSFDPTVIDELQQCPENLDFDQLPTLGELNKAITDMASLAAPGELGLSQMTMKKLPKEARVALLDIIHGYWNGLDENPGGIYTKKCKNDDLTRGCRI
jgi:hypothetical protein